MGGAKGSSERAVTVMVMEGAMGNKRREGANGNKGKERGTQYEAFILYGDIHTLHFSTLFFKYRQNTLSMTLVP